MSALEDNKTNLVCFLLLAQTRQNIDTGGNHHIAGSFLLILVFYICVTGMYFALCVASSNKLTDSVWPTNKISAHTKSSS